MQALNDLIALQQQQVDQIAQLSIDINTSSTLDHQIVQLLTYALSGLGFAFGWMLWGSLKHMIRMKGWLS